MNPKYFSVRATECDLSKCPGAQKMYKEIGCRPIYKDGVCCPVKYECPDLNSRSKEKCYLGDLEFKVGETIPDELTKKHCAPSCRCIQG